MNNLERHIEKDEEVVVSEEYMNGENRKLENRIFVCDGNGFGTETFTSGSAVFGKWKDTQQQDRIEGDMISKEETEAWQKLKDKVAQ